MTFLFAGNVTQATRQSTRTEKQVETLTRDNTELHNNLHELKQKLDSSKARSRALETECSNLKNTMSEIASQNERDLKLVTSLSVTKVSLFLYRGVSIVFQAQKSQFQEVLNGTLAKKQNEIEKLKEKIRDADVMVRKQACQLQNLQKELDKGKNREKNEVAQSAAEKVSYEFATKIKLETFGDHVLYKS